MRSAACRVVSLSRAALQPQRARVSASAARSWQAAAPAAPQQQRRFSHEKLAHRQQRLAEDIYQSYLSFWDHIRFRKGWATPRFEVGDVDGLLERAADHAGHILADMEHRREQSGEGAMLLQRGGDSTAFLMGVEYDPLESEGANTRFVRELVHSTLCDATGYVQGLTSDVIDAKIREAQAEEARRSAIQGLSSLRAKLPDLLQLRTAKAQIPALAETADTLVERLSYILKHGEDLPAADEASREPKVDIFDEQHASDDHAAAAGSAPKKETKTIDVTGYSERVANLVKATDVKWENVKKDPSAYEEALQRLQERCTESSGSLMKDLLALETELSASVSDGPAAEEGAASEERVQMRAQVQTIHELLQNVDEVNRRIHVLKTATQKEKERQELQERQAAEDKREAAEQAAARVKQQQERRESPKRQKEPIQSKQPKQQPKQQEQVPRSVAALRKLLGQIVDLGSNPKVWEQIDIEPSFTQCDGNTHSYASAYLYDLDSDTCRINVNRSELQITGVCRPDPQVLKKAVSRFAVHTLYHHGTEDGAVHFLSQGKSPLDFLKLISEGKWGRFSKTYSLQVPIPPQAIQATVCQTFTTQSSNTSDTTLTPTV